MLSSCRSGPHCYPFIDIEYCCYFLPLFESCSEIIVEDFTFRESSSGSVQHDILNVARPNPQSRQNTKMQLKVASTTESMQPEKVGGGGFQNS